MNQQNEQTEEQPQTLIHSLPDHFLIAVLKHLNLKQLLRCARVCKRWNRCVKDASIWTRIDLRAYKLSLVNLKQLTFTYSSARTVDVLLLGSLNNSQQISKPTGLVCLDSAYFSDYLSIKCFNLKLIHLENLDLTDISANCLKTLASNLEFITLKWCLLSENWFNAVDCLFKRVSTFELIRPGGCKLSNEDIQNICQTMPNLKRFVLNQAESSIMDDSINTICQELIHLKELDLINTSITDQAVLLICSSLKLKRLNLSMSSRISNLSLSSITELLNECLESLYLTSCFGISRIEHFVRLKQLTYLNINNTSIDKQRIKDYLLPLLPNCEIEHGHEKMLNRKLMWTINGSRNSLCV